MGPKKSSWTRLKDSFGFWFGGIWLVAGLPFLLAVIYLVQDDRRYDIEGRIVQGTVLTKEVRRSHSNNGDSTSYYVTYRFADRNGESMEGQEQLGQSEWEKLAERGPVRIVYLPSRVASNRVLGQTNLTLTIIFGILAGFFLLAGGAILFLSVRRVWRGSR